MAATPARDFSAGDGVVLVGTMKGAFVYRRRGSSHRLVSGPHFRGAPVYSLACDDRGGKARLFAGSENPFFGPALHWSDDLGRTWTEPKKPNVRFPANASLTVKQIWQITPGPADDPGLVYCGVNPASLFRSKDRGKTWSLVRGLHDHPHRPKWSPLHPYWPEEHSQRRVQACR